MGFCLNTFPFSVVTYVRNTAWPIKTAVPIRLRVHDIWNLSRRPFPLCSFFRHYKDGIHTHHHERALKPHPTKFASKSPIVRLQLQNAN